MKKTLFVFSEFPRKEQPYIFNLFRELIDLHPGSRVLVFRPTRGEVDPQMSKWMKENRHRVLVQARGWLNPGYWLSFLLLLLRKPQICFSGGVFNDLAIFHWARMRFLYRFASALRYPFDQVYFSSISLIKYFPFPAVFGPAVRIASARGQDFDLMDPLDLHGVRELDRLHVLGDYLKKEAIRFGVDREKIHVIPPYGADAKGSLEKTENSLFVMGTASRLTWLKGHDYILRALKKLKEDGFHFEYRIMGEGPEEDYLKLETRRLDLEDRVKFMGWLSGDQMADELGRLDLYIMFSLSEGFNNTVIQAQKAGVPCIVSNVGGLPENIGNGTGGTVVEAYDVNGLKRAMAEFMQSREKRLEAGRKAAAFAHVEYDYQKHKAGYLALFN